MATVSLETVRSLATDLGFGLCGVAAARPGGHADFARQWIADGKHGEMMYLAERLETRLDPELLFPGVRSVIAVADGYRGSGVGDRGSGIGANHERGDLPSQQSENADRRGRIAKYAWGRDYHKVIKKRLHQLCDALREAHPDADFRATVDTAPIHEREHAARAGLGWIGKHTLLLHPRHGSFFLLGLVLTTLEIETSEAAAHPDTLTPPEDHCANCTRCIDACPTGAIDPAGYTMDPRRCVSYLTIEHRGTIEDALLPGMKDWLAGCDICQDVCPYNAIAGKSGNVLPIRPDYEPRGHANGFDLLDVLSWTEEDRLRHTAGTALTRIKLPMWKRNALIAAGNTLTRREDPGLANAVREKMTDSNDVVRETAEQVWRRIDSTNHRPR